MDSEARKKSEEWSSGESSELSLVVSNFFEIIDRDLAALWDSDGDSDWVRVSTVFALKAKYLLLASYELICSGLASEAGGVLRNCLEHLNILAYLRENPDYAIELGKGKKVRAGEISDRIGGLFADLRRWLNANTVHAEFDFYAMQHLVDTPTGSLNLQPKHSTKRFRYNMIVLAALQRVLVTQLGLRLEYAGVEIDAKSAKAIELTDSRYRTLTSEFMNSKETSTCSMS